MEIDLVYLWVDGNDPEWIRKHESVGGKTSTGTQAECKGRYADNDELKYSLRSVELYAPWIRKIFIVTDNQVPAWLDRDNPKVEIIDHKDILPPAALPCFNSSVLEHFIYRIPGLSEHYLFANDDMLLNRAVSPSDFFTPEGYPVMRVVRRPMERLKVGIIKLLGKKQGNYNTKIRNSALLVKQRYGKYYSFKPHHNIDAYTKELCRLTEEKFKDALEPTFGHHLRNNEDYQRILYYYTAAAEKIGSIEYVDAHTSFQLAIHKSYHYPRLEKYNPEFFCMNDGENATDGHRRTATEYLATRFPEKSAFEK